MRVAGLVIGIALASLPTQFGLAKVRHSKPSAHAAAASYRLPATGDLSAADLARFADQAIEAPADQFSAPFDATPVVGRSFRIAIPIESYGPLKWSYDRSTGSLNISVEGDRLLAINFLQVRSAAPESARRWEQWSQPPHALLVDSRNLGREQKEEQNAFGAKVAVTTLRGRHVYIAEFGDVDGGSLTAPINVTLPMAPDVARAASASLKLEAQGIVVDPDHGHSLRCGGYYDEPTVANPYEMWGDNCVYAVKINRFDIVDGAGRSYWHWSRAP